MVNGRASAGAGAHRQARAPGARPLPTGLQPLSAADLGRTVSSIESRKRRSLPSWPKRQPRARRWRKEVRQRYARHRQAIDQQLEHSLTVMGFAGPTFFNVLKQQLVTDVNFVHPEKVQADTPSTRLRSPVPKESPAGNPPRLSDSTWERATSPITSLHHVGIGWFTRYSRATCWNFRPRATEHSTSSPVGCMSAGGLRLRF